MPYRICKQYTFEAAHHLPEHDGKCRRPHGHSYRADIELMQDELQASGPQTGMVLDFAHIDRVVKPLLEQYLDHFDLNETLEQLVRTSGTEDDVSDARVPTAERLARFLFQACEHARLPVSRVRVYETAKCWAEFAR
jgi:6-pyruvoyltetrahydropterin/6-carboxytetrahydropterin synthase